MTTTGSNASAPSLDGTGTDRNATASLHQPAVPAHRRSVMPWVWLCAMILTLLCGMAIKVLFVDSGEGISISGATIFWDSDLSGNSFLNLTVTESQVNSVLVILFIFFLCRFLTAGMSVRPGGARQIVAEWLVEKASGLVESNMGPAYYRFAPFIAGMMALSLFSSLSSLVGMYAPTSDINIVSGWAVVSFVLITRSKMRVGVGNYLKGFTQPIWVLTPFNVIGEVATPVSMTFRHYGNVLSGAVISTMLYAALGALSGLVFGWIPVIGDAFPPVLQIGIPGILSLYFDLFSSGLQAFIFAMLTMLYVASGSES